MASDRAALQELLRQSRSGVRHRMLHYLYFPRRDGAVASAERLQSLGFRAETRIGADGVNWLVLARHDVVPTEESIASVRKTMDELARQHDGEYDGWEAEVV